MQTPSNTNREMFEKADEYIKDDYQMVCIIFPEKRIASVHYADGEYELLVDGDILDGGDVLPGFTLPVATFPPNHDIYHEVTRLSPLTSPCLLCVTVEKRMD